MATTNPITGDSLISKTLTEEGEKNYEAIFGKKKKTNGGWTPPDTSWDNGEERMDNIGRNSNEGLHYDSTSESTD
jgi:hypothetical protein